MASWHQMVTKYWWLGWDRVFLITKGISLYCFLHWRDNTSYELGWRHVLNYVVWISAVCFSH